MSSICELLKTKQVKEIHCDELTCTIQFNDFTRILAYEGFKECFQD